jgi:hypothetical protein
MIDPLPETKNQGMGIKPPDVCFVSIANNSFVLAERGGVFFIGAMATLSIDLIFSKY